MTTVFNSSYAIHSGLKKRIENLELLNITKGNIQESISVLKGSFIIKKINISDTKINVVSGKIHTLSGFIEIDNGLLNLSVADYDKGIKSTDIGTEIFVSMGSKLFVKSTNTCIGNEITVYGYVRLISDTELNILNMDIIGDQCCDTTFTMCGTTTTNFLNTIKDLVVGGNITMQSSNNQRQSFNVGEACLVLYLESNETVNLIIDQYVKSLVVIIKNSKHEIDQGDKFINVIMSENIENTETVQFGKTATFLQTNPKNFVKIYET